jgi:uncharacterized protein (DUF433 family)
MSKSNRRTAEIGGTGRWSARRKAEAVLPLLKGEDLDTLSRQRARPSRSGVSCGAVRHSNLRGRAATGYRGSLFKEPEMTLAERITVDPAVMGGRPCVRGLRVSVGTVVGLVAAGRSNAEILALYPYLEPDDIRAALEYAAWRVDELERPFTTRTA